MHASKDFVLHGGGKEFANRQKLLFDQLTIAEAKCHKTKVNTATADTIMDVDESNEYQQILKSGQKRKSETKRFRGKESIFKRPEGPAPRTIIRNTPDHHRNPHKWLKYSLDDVSIDDMTEQSNTQAALSFLNELKARRLNEQMGQVQKLNVHMTEPHQKDHDKFMFSPQKVKKNMEIKFKKPESDAGKIAINSVIIDNNEKPIFRSSRVIMPEYIVGQKQKKRYRDKPKVKIVRTKELKLDHLQDIDEEEN